MITVVGLDVCKSSVVACVLSEKPRDVKRFYLGGNFPKLKADASGIRELLALKLDIAIMEPTGVNYSRLWGTQLARVGVEVRLVGHKELRNYREHLSLPDKDDEADALAMACYYFDFCESPRRFLQVRDGVVARIRELVLRLAHLNRVQSPIVNRLRQDLAWQCPELMNVNSRRSPLAKANHEFADIPLLWGWMAGIRPSKKYDRALATTVGEGLKDLTRKSANILCQLQQQEAEIERELRAYLDDSRFLPYRRVFREFGFGERVEAILLSQIFPIENFLDDDGKPEIVIRQGKNSKKPTKRHLSERRFLKSLGCAPTKESSGDSRRVRVVGGSDLCRKALWQWIFSRVEPRHCRPQTEICQIVGAELDKRKASEPAQLARSHAAAKAAKLLFRELVRAKLSETAKR